MSRWLGRVRLLNGGFPAALIFGVLVLIGFSLNLYLFFMRSGHGRIAGCDGGGCEQALASRWSVVFGVPVTVFGALVYLGLMVSLLPRARRLAAPLLAMVLGSAVWFAGVQVVLLGGFCGWCLAAHGVGLAVVGVGWSHSVRRLVGWSYAGFLLIGLLQLYGPVQPAYQVAGSPMPVVEESVQARGDGRKVSFANGGKSFAVEALPRIGSVEARHVMVEYFDYQCPACRLMSGYLSALIEKHPAEICVLLMPVPLDPVCNDSFLPGDVGHPQSCEFTRIALAVWRANPVAFPSFHRDVLADPKLKTADVLRLAYRHVPRAELERALEDPWIDELVAANIADWVSISGKIKQLPKLLIRDKRILHGLPESEAEFIRVIGQELDLN